MSEKHYDFRKFLDEVHQKDLRDSTLQPGPDETEITPEWTIRIPENTSDFVLETGRDLADYLLTGMEVGVRIARGEPEIGRAHV